MGERNRQFIELTPVVREAILRGINTWEKQKNIDEIRSVLNQVDTDSGFLVTGSAIYGEKCTIYFQP